MTKVKVNGVVVGHVEELGHRFVAFSNNHNMKNLFGADVFNTEAEAVQFVIDLNIEEVDA
jgi:hypothetical protein